MKRLFTLLVAFSVLGLSFGQSSFTYMERSTQNEEQKQAVLTSSEVIQAATASRSANAAGPDLVVFIEGFVKQYYSVPLAQASIEMEALVGNIGDELTEATNSNLTVGTGYDEDVAIPVPLGAGSEVSITFPVFTATETGEANFVVTANASDDADPDNGFDVKNLMIDDEILSRNNDVYAGNISIGSPDGIIGGTFEILAEDVLSGVTFYLVAPTIGDIHQVVVYNFDGTPTTLVATAMDVLITEQNAYYTAIFAEELTLSPGTYYVGIKEGANAMQLGHTTDEYVPLTAWVYFNNAWTPSEDYNFPHTHMINLEFDEWQPPLFDISMEEITMPAYMLAGSVDVTGTIRNLSVEELTSIDISYTMNDGDPVTQTFNVSVGPSETYDFTFDNPVNISEIGLYAFDIMLSNPNGQEDENPENDMSSHNLSVPSASEQRVPCFEEFTSSTCAPCATFNTPFVPWCEDHAEDITLIKYQMNWPGSGDPYYTNEGGQRRTYYSVNSVPATFGDGIYLGYDMASVNTFYNASMANPSVVAIASSHTLSGTQMDITTTVLPFVGIDNGLVQIIVFENVTTQNTGNNGETEFHHVMMKMVPDAAGTTNDFDDRDPVTYQNSVELSGTNVEEWDDLGVIVIVQDYISQSVFQSGYSVEDADYSTDDELTSLNLDGELIPGFDPNVLDYWTQLDEGTTVPPVVTYTVSDESARTILIDASELPGETTVDVFAEDLATHKKYTIHFSIVAGVENRLADKVKLYPNPTTGLLNISGFERADVAVYSSTGALVGEYKDFNERSIDISGMPNGIYFVNIQTEEDVVTKRVTLYR